MSVQNSDMYSVLPVEKTEPEEEKVATGTKPVKQIKPCHSQHAS